MMNSSAGVPRRACGSARSAGGTWPCGQTSGRSLTVAYSSRATARRAGSASKQRSGASAQRVLGMILFLQLQDLRREREQGTTTFRSDRVSPDFFGWSYCKHSEVDFDEPFVYKTVMLNRELLPNRYAPTIIN